MLQVNRIINSFFDSITWLLSETESNQVWLVDCGDIAPIIEKMGDKTIAGVFLTHSHFDHIYGLPSLITHFPASRIYTNEAGRRALTDARQNMSLYLGRPITVSNEFISLCREGDEIELYTNVKVRVFETPGHHPSCLSYIVGDCLFSGDAYIPGMKIITNLPGGDKEMANKSKARIKSLLYGRHLCPGHLCATK